VLQPTPQRPRRQRRAHRDPGQIGASGSANLRPGSQTIPLQAYPTEGKGGQSKAARRTAGASERSSAIPTAIHGDLGWPESGAGSSFGLESQLMSLSTERQELLFSCIGLVVKLGLVAVTAISLVRLAGAYQQRMESQGEISAVLELESAKLNRARERFDALFMVEGEQRLIREQSQWIAPNRLRVVWQSAVPYPSVETADSRSGKQLPRP
jgi:hypothetical protein